VTDSQFFAQYHTIANELVLISIFQIGGAVPVLPDELQATLYRPISQEWPHGGRDATCTRILRGLDQIMGLAIAEPFIAPVDLNRYPSYALIVEYPIDLSTIKVSTHGT